VTNQNKRELFFVEDSLSIVTTNMAAPSNGMTKGALYTNGIFLIRNLDSYVTDHHELNSMEQTCIHSGKNYMYILFMHHTVLNSVRLNTLAMAAIINKDMISVSFLIG
jgi:hypothetical protein